MYSVLITALTACSDQERPPSEPIEDFTGLEEDTGEETAVEPLEFMGSWEDNYGALIEVQEDTITIGTSSFAISSYENAAGWVTAQNSSTNSHNPNLWSKFDWHMGEVLYYCQIAYDASDEEIAMAINADSSDLETGCNGFSWSILRTQIDVMGSYVDNLGNNHVISSFLWTSGESISAISTSSNEEGWAVAKNDSGNTYNPDLWSKFEWYYTTESVYYCQSSIDSADAETAQAVMADRTDLETGCVGFSWNTLTVTE